MLVTFNYNFNLFYHALFNSQHLINSYDVPKSVTETGNAESLAIRESAKVELCIGHVQIIQIRSIDYRGSSVIEKEPHETESPITHRNCKKGLEKSLKNKQKCIDLLCPYIWQGILDILLSDGTGAHIDGYAVLPSMVSKP